MALQVRLTAEDARGTHNHGTQLSGRLFSDGAHVVNLAGCIACSKALSLFLAKEVIRNTRARQTCSRLPIGRRGLGYYQVWVILPEINACSQPIVTPHAGRQLRFSGHDLTCDLQVATVVADDGRIHFLSRRASGDPFRFVGEFGQPSAPIRLRNASAACRLAGRFRVAASIARTSSSIRFAESSTVVILNPIS